ncbi:expressed unknown protein [Seminavis robusta]|uniref:Uncharacterized protein n=1 Tax=Seminavis robusta TaxID=568900 RepID=A0A9N8DXW8_9STRA|nr:expressed unknown protein [Seminavis robusta]|eukprot:Sro460_g147590.1 n/a (419) ;mRNA; f:51413-52669
MATAFSPPSTNTNCLDRRLLRLHEAWRPDSSNDQEMQEQAPPQQQQQQQQPQSSLVDVARELAQQGRDTLQSTADASVTSAKNAAQMVGGLSTEMASKGRNTVGAAWSGVSNLTGGIAATAQQGSGRLTSAGQKTLGLVSNKSRDVFQWMDTQAKEGTSVVQSKARDMVLGFTGKSDYQFGDIAKEVVRRASTADYNLQDIILLLRVMLTLGASVTPLAKLLPITVLLEMLNTTIEARLGGKLLEVLAQALDERFMAAFSAEELGDLAKRSLSAAIIAFTGKASYQKGDIEETVSKMNNNNNNNNNDATQQEENGQDEKAVNNATTEVAVAEPLLPPSVSAPPRTLELRIGPDFDDWDRAFRESHPDVDIVVEQSLDRTTRNNSQSPSATLEALDKEFVNELEEWDRKFESMMYENKQ